MNPRTLVDDEPLLTSPGDSPHAWWAGVRVRSGNRSIGQHRAEAFGPTYTKEYREDAPASDTRAPEKRHRDAQKAFIARGSPGTRGSRVARKWWVEERKGSLAVVVDTARVDEMREARGEWTIRLTLACAHTTTTVVLHDLAEPVGRTLTHLRDTRTPFFVFLRREEYAVLGMYVAPAVHAAANGPVAKCRDR